jgi:hypothetical protein
LPLLFSGRGSIAASPRTLFLKRIVGVRVPNAEALGENPLRLRRVALARARKVRAPLGRRGSARNRKHCAPEFAQDLNGERWAGSRSGECG